MINYNGELMPDDSLIFGSQNRAFRYGDSLFESILWESFLIEEHYERLTKGIAFLGMERPDYFDFYFFRNEIQKTCNGMEQARVRFTVFREEGGLYTPKTNGIHYLIEAQAIERYYPGNEMPKSIGIIESVQLPTNPLSNLKTGNSLPYVLAAIEQKKADYDLGIILNDKGRIAEATGWNIFVVKDKKVSTPALSEGCIAGTMRAYLLKNTKIREAKITIQDLKEADEIFITNAVKIWQSVGQFGDKQYATKFTEWLFRM